MLPNAINDSAVVFGSQDWRGWSVGGAGSRVGCWGRPRGDDGVSGGGAWAQLCLSVCCAEGGRLCNARGEYAASRAVRASGLGEV